MNLAYDYLKQIGVAVKNNKPLPVYRVNLVGSRMSGKTFAVIDTLIIASLVNVCRTDAFRHFKGKDRQELFDQFIEQVNYWLLGDVVEIHKTNMTITFPNGSVIAVNGLHSPTQKDEVKMTGKAMSAKFKYHFAFAEERYEINDKDWADVLQAIRGSKNFMEIHAANPWILGADYIKYIHEHLPFNLEELKKNGEQFKVFDKEIKTLDGDSFKYKEVFHITNYMINKHLSVIDKVKLELAAKADPHRANTILYGFYGTPEGSIWKWVLPKMTQKPIYQSTTYVGGVDYGERDDPTAAYIVGFANGYREAHIKHEYYYRNKMGLPHKDTKDFAEDVVEHFIDFYESNHLQGELAIWVDGAAIPFITALNTYCEDLNWNDVIHFYQQTDKKRVADRTETMKTMAAFDIIKVDSQCKELLRELNEQTYSDKTRSSVDYVNGDNHGTDAIYYGLATAWVQLLENMDYVQEQQAQQIIKEREEQNGTKEI